jgi:hypothetical protein
MLYGQGEGRGVAIQISRLRRKAAAADALADKVMREDMSPAPSLAKAL